LAIDGMPSKLVGQLGEPVAEPAEGLGLLGSALATDLLGHGRSAVAHLHLAAHRSGEGGPVHGVDREEGEVVAQLGAGGGEDVGQDPGHREH